MLVDAGLTVVWQEPVSALYAEIVQGRLGDDLRRLELAQPSAIDLAALRSLEDERQRMAFLARTLRRTARRAATAVGRIRLPRGGGELGHRRRHRRRLAAQGAGDLRRRARSRARPARSRSPATARPTARRFAGSTSCAPATRSPSRCRTARSSTASQQTRIVAPTEVSVVRRVAYDRLVLTACHPLYSAAQADRRLRPPRVVRAARPGARHVTPRRMDTCGRRGHGAQARGGRAR